MVKRSASLQIPSDLPAAETAPLQPTASFISGTDGKPRLSWARYSVPYGAYTSSSNALPMTLGGRFAREAPLAQAIAWDVLTSNPALWTVVQNLTTNAIGSGLTLSSKPDAEALGVSEEVAQKISDAIEREFNRWSSNPTEVDATGRFDLAQIASAGYIQYLLSGELFTLIDWTSVRGAKTKTKITLLDNRQIDRTIVRQTSDQFILNGIVFDKSGHLTGYMVRSLPIGNANSAPPAVFIPHKTPWGRTRVIHAFEAMDPRQVRGISPLVAALTPAHERESLNEFALANALLQTTLALSIESDLPAQAALAGLSAGSADVMSNMTDLIQIKQSWYEQAKINPQPATVNHLSPGDHLHFNSVKNPSAAYQNFEKSLTSSAARAAGDAYESVSGDYSNVNFSASRMATEMPHRLNLKRRKFIVEKFYKEVYAAWLEEAIERRIIDLPPEAPPFQQFKDAYSNAAFVGVGRVQPDEKKHADATILRLENGLVTLTDALAESGIDFESHIRQLKTERAVLAKYGLEHPAFPGAVTTQTRDNIEERGPASSTAPQTSKRAS